MGAIRGVILGGGLGTRLLPCTRVCNKHLLPVYDRPMIFYPLRTLVQAGIDEILLVAGGPHAGDYLPMLGTGRELGIRKLEYTWQPGEGGIAEALALAEPFAGGGRVCLILGDTIIQGNIRAPLAGFLRQPRGARVLLSPVPDARGFGVAVLKDGRITRILEKPDPPPTNLAVAGIYFYDAHVFEILRTLQPSARGELEITDVNNAYLAEGTLEHDLLDGWWIDAGTFESMHQAATLIRAGGANLD